VKKEMKREEGKRRKEMERREEKNSGETGQSTRTRAVTRARGEVKWERRVRLCHAYAWVDFMLKAQFRPKTRTTLWNLYGGGNFESTRTRG